MHEAIKVALAVSAKLHHFTYAAALDAAWSATDMALAQLSGDTDPNTAVYKPLDEKDEGNALIVEAAGEDAAVESSEPLLLEMARHDLTSRVPRRQRMITDRLTILVKEQAAAQAARSAASERVRQIQVKIR